MAQKSLIIVESPAKAKTINKILGSGFFVKSSVGHIKDLPQKRLGIDIDHDFRPEFVVMPGKLKVLMELKKAAQNADQILLAADPDREGEAICWHLYEELRKENQRIHRVLFTEITPNVVKQAIKSPIGIDSNKIEAQLARRILDRLVGYQISPLLWRKVSKGLSAGRVQSVAVRLICEREREILAFVPEEYWSINALLQGSKPGRFEAGLKKIDGKNFKLSNQDEAKAVVDEASKQEFILDNINKKTKRRNPYPPYITSTLTQDASIRLRFSPKKTMRLAQDLYEGIEIGNKGPVGLITYMRTDSVRISKDFVQEARQFIADNFSSKHIPSKPNIYKSSKSAQEAHEAIRPTSMANTPESLKNYLRRDQYLVYKLIWDRFVASQMSPAQFFVTTFTIKAGRFTFQASGQQMIFDGFLAVYQDHKPEKNGDDNNEKEPAAVLPELKKGEKLSLIELNKKQHFTTPPPRYSEASLIKELEQNGVGRPSTYAAIISTILDRNYVELNKRKFQPTELGFLVNDLLVENFPRILDVKFTAQMEESLDKIELGKLDRLKLLDSFYRDFHAALKEAEKKMREVKKEITETDEKCELCGSKMIIRMGKNGRFLGCSAFPKCKFTKPLNDQDNAIDKQAESISDLGNCPQCGSPLALKRGKYGPFIACTGYPKCRYTKPFVLDIPCPKDGCDGKIVPKRSKKGKTFYVCSNSPKCDFIAFKRPQAKGKTKKS